MTTFEADLQFDPTVDTEFAANWEAKKVYDPEGLQAFTMFSLEDENGQELWEYRRVGKNAATGKEKTALQDEKDKREAKLAELAAFYQNEENEGVSPFGNSDDICEAVQNESYEESLAGMLDYMAKMLED